MRVCTPGAVARIRCSATSATTSRYAHHTAAEMSTPSRAPTIRAPRSRPSAPTPMATIDSPSAMRTMTP
jgi:hypothetical protein